MSIAFEYASNRHLTITTNFLLKVITETLLDFIGS